MANRSLRKGDEEVNKRIQFKIYNMSASPHAEKKNAWWISTIELVEKYETAN